MLLTLETFLVAVYTYVDDLYIEHFAPDNPLLGRPPAFANSEVLTLTILADWSFNGRYAPMLRYVRAHWLDFFPDVVTPSAFNKRVAYLHELLPQVASRLAAIFHPQGVALQIIDGVGVAERSISRAKHRCATDADMGYCGTPKRAFFGFKVAVCVSPDAMIMSWTSGPASTEERYLLSATLRLRCDAQAPDPTGHDHDLICGLRHRPAGERNRVGPRGPLERGGREVKQVQGLLMLADSGYVSAPLQEHWKQVWGVDVVTPADWCKGSQLEGWRCTLRRIRQRAEQVIGALGHGRKVPTLSARRTWSVRARIGAMMARHNLNVLLNRLFGLAPLHRIEPLSLPRA